MKIIWIFYLIVDKMRTKCPKEIFDTAFPQGIKQSKERIRRFLANHLLLKGYSLEQTKDFVYRQIP